jgi:hypothetical protein
VEIVSLGYWSRQEVHPLPEWAGYLTALGAFAAQHREPGRRLVVGLSVPSRAYVAAFCALGVSITAYEDHVKEDPREHFERLVGLPPRTAIRFRRGRYLYYGLLLGAEGELGDEYLKYADGAAICYLRWNKCGNIRTLEPGEDFTRRRLLAPNSSFVEASLPGIDPLTHASDTTLDCLVVGNLGPLRDEIVDQEFVAVTAEGTQVPGVLNDLLRCDAFELNANDHDRTSILSAFCDDVPERLLSEPPPAVVFDGPAAFLRLRSHWRKSPWVVVIDRTTASAVAAGDAFNQEMALSLEDADLAALGDVPAVFEVCAYYERLR